MNCDTCTLSIVTRNSFSACGAFIAQQCTLALVATSNPGLGRAFAETLEHAPGMGCLLLDLNGQPSPFLVEMDQATGFSLVMLQPLWVPRDSLLPFLKHPKLRQVIELRASGLGSRLLPEWNCPAEPEQHSLAALRREMLPAPGWRWQEYRAGSLASLFYGMCSRRFLALGRLDLALRCNAHMRRHLALRSPVPGPAYLTITRVDFTA